MAFRASGRLLRRPQGLLGRPQLRRGQHQQRLALLFRRQAPVELQRLSRRLRRLLRLLHLQEQLRPAQLRGGQGSPGP